MDLLTSRVKVTIPRAALDAIYNECDGFDQDETGGRLIGTYNKGLMKGLHIVVTGIIEPGPNAKRSQTSFFQDGEYQEKVFRQVEERHPDVEHLGNWHTHHVNGYPTLSSGDRTTYHNNVNHRNHNTDFFYAVLVTAKNKRGDGERYSVRHFVLFRGDHREYEIPATRVTVVDSPVVWPKQHAQAHQPAQPASTPAAALHVNADDPRAADSDFFKRFQPSLKPFMSKGNGRVQWRGAVELVDDSKLDVVVAELEGDEAVEYGVLVKSKNAKLQDVFDRYGARRFASAREAILLLERDVNRALYNLNTKVAG
jgi:integrative and conjugative element protein (TIGR02256 family)